MSKFYFIFSGLFFFAVSRLNAQVNNVASSLPLDKITIGVGVGYDYGGYGGNAIYYPQRSIGIFGGVGYANAGVGYNAGVKLRLITNRSATLVSPFVLAMYGYYADAAPKDYSYYNKLFYGTTIGGGFDVRPNKSIFGYLTGTILIPLRNPDPQRYIDNLSLFSGLDYHKKLHSVSFSIGYKFILFQRHDEK